MSDIVIIAGEKCRLVTSMDELCVGAIVWVVDSRCCGRKRRNMLISRYNGPVYDPSSGIQIRETGWDGVPRHICAGREILAASALAVREGRVYRVIDTSDSSASTSTDRKAKEKA